MKALLSVSLLLAICGALAWAETPLGDIARQQRAIVKPPTKIYTNDDLLASAPATASASPSPAEQTTEPAPASGQKTPKNGKAASSAKDEKDESESNPSELRAKFLARYAQQKKSIDKIEQDLSALQHDYDKQTTVYWMDAGSQLRDQQKWAEKRRKMEEDIDKKQVRLQIAKEKLDEIKDEAHRAGLPLTMFEE